MRTNIIFVGVAMLLPLATPASARVGRPDPAELLARADANHDGVVSRQEFLAARSARFDTFDRNHDGSLSDADMPRFVHNNADRMQKFHTMRQMADANQDGKVSRDEFVAAGNRMFGMIDLNHDNSIDSAEIKKATERLQAMAAGRGAP